MSKKEEILLPKGAVQSLFPFMVGMSEHEKTSLRKTHYYRRRMTSEVLTFDDLARISVPKIWELTRVTESTINRWKAGKHEVPFATQPGKTHDSDLCGDWLKRWRNRKKGRKAPFL